MAPKEIMQAALLSLGPNGENWNKGKPTKTQVCAVMACVRVMKLPPKDAWAGETHFDNIPELDIILEAMYSALPDHEKEFLEGSGQPKTIKCRLAVYNDQVDSTFADIKGLYERAIQSLEA